MSKFQENEKCKIIEKDNFISNLNMKTESLNSKINVLNNSIKEKEEYFRNQEIHVNKISEENILKDKEIIALNNKFNKFEKQMDLSSINELKYISMENELKLIRIKVYIY